MTGVKQKWYEIGVDLELEHKVNNIRHQYSDPDVCLREMFKERLQPYYPYPITWRNIMDALRSPGVAESQLADELEVKYCPSEFTNNNNYCTSVNTMQYITLEVVVCCVNSFSVKC